MPGSEYPEKRLTVLLGARYHRPHKNEEEKHLVISISLLCIRRLKSTNFRCESESQEIRGVRDKRAHIGFVFKSLPLAVVNI